MIELNLLPDVKLEYIKAQKSRRLVISISVLATIVSVVLLIVLLGISSLQKKHLSDLTADIKQKSSALQAKQDINKILTVQNELQSLTDLHAGKPAATHLLGYLNQVTPAQVSITNFTTDFTAQTASVTGTADSLATINKYVDTLKATNYTAKPDDGDESKPAPAFNNVVLTSFGLSKDVNNAGQAASYTITFSYDKLIFDITQAVKLTVPNPSSTHVEDGSSSALFKGTN